MTTLPKKTYELRLCFSGENPVALKEAVKDVLIAQGVDSFVEAAIDGLDIDFEEVNWDALQAVEDAAASSALSVFKYDRSYLELLASHLAQHFDDKLSLAITESDTELWTEGWKDSFRPIETKAFWIYPPWDLAKPPEGKIPLVMDPGMAFGTGQHATTKLCLGLIEDVCLSRKPLSMLDVGTGTGILSIAAAKLGVADIVASDIDADAVLAAAANAQANGVTLGQILRGSVPRGVQAELVVANILTVVLERILPELAAAVAAEGELILSGILAEDHGRLVEQANSFHLVLEEQRVDEGWCGLRFKRV